LSPSADHAVTVQRDGVFTLWNGLSPGPPQSGGQSEASFVAFSPAGDAFATAHANGTVEIRSVLQPDRPLTLARHARAVRHVAFSADGKIVATGSDDNTARVWRVDDSATTGLVVISHPQNVSDVTFSADGQQVLSASTRGDVRLSRLDGTTIEPWRFSHPAAARGAREAAVSARGDWVLSVGTDDGKARMWSTDPSTKRRTRVLGDPEDPDNKVVHARFNGDGTRLVTASSDGTARIWSVDREDDVPLRLRGHETGKPLHGAAFSPNGALVVTASADSTARVWNATTGAAVTDAQERPLVFMHGAGAEVLDAAFSPGSDRIITAATDNAARIWSVDGGAAIELPHPRIVRLAAFSPDGTRVVTACDDGIVRVWAADGSGSPTQLTGHDPAQPPYASGTATSSDSRPQIVTALFSKDGTRILSASQDGTARIWNADGAGNPIVLRHPRALIGAAFNPAADQVVTGSIDSKARIWTLAPASLLKIIRSRTRTCLPPEFRLRNFLEGEQDAANAFQACQARVAAGTP
jgi:WD40 repeat protein